MKNQYRNWRSRLSKPRASQSSIHPTPSLIISIHHSGDLWQTSVSSHAVNQASKPDLPSLQFSSGIRDQISSLTRDSPLQNPAKSHFKIPLICCEDFMMEIKPQLNLELIALYRADHLPSSLYIIILSSLNKLIRSSASHRQVLRGSSFGAQLEKHSQRRDIFLPSRRLFSSVQREDNTHKARIIALRLDSSHPQDSSVNLILWSFYLTVFSSLLTAVSSSVKQASLLARTAPRYRSSSLYLSCTSAGRSSYLLIVFFPLLSLSEQIPFLFNPTSAPPLSSLLFCSSDMAKNQRNSAPAEFPENLEMQGNPLDRVITNSECTLCKAHCFMIARFVKHFNELKEDIQADSRSKRKNLEKQKAEIENLKEKCNHMEEAINHIKSITQSMQAETSTRASAKKEFQYYDSVNQF